MPNPFLLPLLFTAVALLLPIGGGYDATTTAPGADDTLNVSITGTNATTCRVFVDGNEIFNFTTDPSLPALTVAHIA